jgi:hypothetical protein
LKKVWLRPLAAPDALDFSLPERHICLVSDDGSHISKVLVERLRSRGWPVVVLRYYDAHKPLPVSVGTENTGFKQVPYFALTSDDESHIQQQLDAIISQFGPIAVFIHVHPRYSLSSGSVVHFDSDSEKMLRQVFLTAKYLQPNLTAAAKYPESGVRACFMTVTQLDGGFGLREERDIDVIVGGLSGLTKTLALEWPQVFCRAVDINPDLSQQAVNYVLAELFDPNRCYVEVGWHKLGRVTPEVS